MFVEHMDDEVTAM